MKTSMVVWLLQVQGGSLPSFTAAEPYQRVLGLQHHLHRLPEEEQFQYTVNTDYAS